MLCVGEKPPGPTLHASARESPARAPPCMQVHVNRVGKSNPSPPQHILGSSLACPYGLACGKFPANEIAAHRLIHDLLNVLTYVLDVRFISFKSH
jgi:hypothetical protein